jgi:hypothetical protein
MVSTASTGLASCSVISWGLRRAMRNLGSIRVAIPMTASATPVSAGHVAVLTRILVSSVVDKVDNVSLLCWRVDPSMKLSLSLVAPS